MAGLNASLNATGIVLSSVARFGSLTRTNSSVLSNGVQILPGFILFDGSNAVLIRLNSVNNDSPKNAGPYSLRNPLPCSPHIRPPCFATNATTSSEIWCISFSCSGSHKSNAGLTCNTPASTWPNMPYCKPWLSNNARNSIMKSARFSGGTPVSSAKAIGFWLPLVLPSRPTDFFRMA